MAMSVNDHISAEYFAYISKRVSQLMDQMTHEIKHSETDRDICILSARVLGLIHAIKSTLTENLSYAAEDMDDRDAFQAMLNGFAKDEMDAYKEKLADLGKLVSDADRVLN